MRRVGRREKWLKRRKEGERRGASGRGVPGPHTKNFDRGGVDPTDGDGQRGTATSCSPAKTPLSEMRIKREVASTFFVVVVVVVVESRRLYHSQKLPLGSCK